MNIRFLSAALATALLSSFNAAPLAAQDHVIAANVLVIGGTPAGIAAALAAARRGESVELVVRRPQLGGILSDAMMDQWDLNLAQDGEPIQGGIFTEIHARLGDSFTPAQATRTFTDLIAAEPRIHLITQAAAVQVQTSGAPTSRTVTGVTFRDVRTEATFNVAAPYVIDATDDGDVAALAGARFGIGRQDTGRDERMQPVTLMFAISGVDWAPVENGYDDVRYGRGGATDRRAWGYAELMRDYRPSAPNVLVRDLNLGHEDGGNVTVNAIDILGIDGRSDADLARARAQTIVEAPRLVAWLRERVPGFANARIARYADAVYVRETRHFAGLERLTANDVWDGDVPADTIGLSSYPLDLHPTTVDEKPAFAPVRHVYGIPYGALIPRDLTNLALASPAISASHLASGSARVIPTTIEEGEAAGASAALAERRKISFATLARDRVDMTALREDLAHSGVILAPTALAHARTAARG